MREKPPREWSKAEACAHFDWFLKIKGDRVNQIALASGAAKTDRLDLKLGCITETIRRSLDNLARRDGDVQHANGLGLIAAFDAALVVGDALAQNIDGASWQIMRTRVERFHSNNFPVVRTRSLWAFEPFFEGRRALSLIGRETNGEHTNVLETMYREWCEHLQQKP